MQTYSRAYFGLEYCEVAGIATLYTVRLISLLTPLAVFLFHSGSPLLLALCSLHVLKTVQLSAISAFLLYTESLFWRWPLDICSPKDIV
jgi:hypothetical protein